MVKNPTANARVERDKIFPTQGLNPGLLHCRWILYCLSHQGSPIILEWVAYPFSRRSSQPKNQTKVLCIAGKFFTRWATREAPNSPILTSKCPQGTPCQVRRKVLTAWDPCHPGLQPNHPEYHAITIQSYSGGWQNGQILQKWLPKRAQGKQVPEPFFITPTPRHTLESQSNSGSFLRKSLCGPVSSPINWWSRL